jgi:hypothetical protein
MLTERVFDTLFRLRLLATWVRRGIRRGDNAQALGIHAGLYMRDALMLTEQLPTKCNAKQLAYIVGAQG